MKTKKKKHFKFIDKIDFTSLRIQKTLLLETINNDAVDPEHKEALEGILSLIDAIQDYAVDEMGVPEMLVFDFEKEEDRENPDPDKTKTLWLCASCNSDNVEFKVWANANTNEVRGDSPDAQDCWCADCQDNTPLYLSTLKANAKVVGFQVVGRPEGNKDGDIHPNMPGSFCIYNLSQARKMIGEDNRTWQLLTIWTGDVEEPTMMFKGDPRK
jgi:hypothetical protein